MKIVWLPQSILDPSSSREGQNFSLFNDLPVPNYWEPWTMGITTVFWWSETTRKYNLTKRYPIANPREYVGGLGEEYCSDCWKITIVMVEKPNDRWRRWTNLPGNLLQSKSGRGFASFCQTRVFPLSEKVWSRLLYANEEELRRALFDKAPSNPYLFGFEGSSPPTRIRKEAPWFFVVLTKRIRETFKNKSWIFILIDKIRRSKSGPSLCGWIGWSWQLPFKLRFDHDSIRRSGWFYLVESLPGVDLHVIKLTNMGPKLTNLSFYS